jgi:hypothetical protein
MLITTLVLFALAALLGLAVARQIFQRKPTSKGVAVAHGACGAAGLVALILQAVKSPSTLLITAIGLFVVAALGGMLVFVNDLRGKVGPIGLVVIHALVAVVGVALVVVAALG